MIYYFVTCSRCCTTFETWSDIILLKFLILLVCIWDHMHGWLNFDIESILSSYFDGIPFLGFPVSIHFFQMFYNAWIESYTLAIDICLNVQNFDSYVKVDTYATMVNPHIDHMLDFCPMFCAHLCVILSSWFDYADNASWHYNLIIDSLHGHVMFIACSSLMLLFCLNYLL